MIRHRGRHRRGLIKRFEEGGAVAPEEPAPKVEEPKSDTPAPQPEPDKVEEKEVEVDEPEETAINKLLNKLFGYMPKSVASWLKRNGDRPIEKIVIKRSPVTSAITRIMDLASLGGLSRAQQKLSYDRLWHLYMEFALEGGGRYMTEKNETIKLTSAKADAKHTEEYPIKLKGPITPNELLGNALKRYGEKKLTVYNAFGKGLNCQGYMLMLLSASGLLTSGARKFIEQDAQAIAKDLPNFIPKKAKQVTDVAATINKILEVLSGGRLHLEEGGLVP